MLFCSRQCRSALGASKTRVRAFQAEGDFTALKDTPYGPSTFDRSVSERSKGGLEQILPICRVWAAHIRSRNAELQSLALALHSGILAQLELNSAYPFQRLSAHLVGSNLAQRLPKWLERRIKRFAFGLVLQQIYKAQLERVA